MFLNPGAASIDCEDCARYLYDFQTGERLTYEAEEGVFLPVVRRPDQPTECSSCPKGSPENYRDNLRLLTRNWKAYDLWKQLRGNPNLRLPEYLAGCSILARNLYSIDQVIKSVKAELRSNAMEREEDE